MIILWVNIQVRSPPSWNSIFRTTWLRFSSWPWFWPQARNRVAPWPGLGSNMLNSQLKPALTSAGIPANQKSAVRSLHESWEASVMISFDTGRRKQVWLWDSTHKERMPILLTVGNQVSILVLVIAACAGTWMEENSIFHWHSHFARYNPKHERQAQMSRLRSLSCNHCRVLQQLCVMLVYRE